MRYFFDTEFLEDGVTIEPISLGICAEDGREFYIEFDFDESRVVACSWPSANVLPHLMIPRSERMSREAARNALLEFIGDDPKPEFWAWYAAYDWVLLCQLFGKMIHLPKHFPKFVRDLKQVCDEYSISRKELPPDPKSSHHALSDARWLKSSFETVQGIYDGRIEAMGLELASDLNLKLEKEREERVRLERMNWHANISGSDSRMRPGIDPSASRRAKSQLLTPCCNKPMVPTSGDNAGRPCVMFNEFNEVVQCHRCGDVWLPRSPVGGQGAPKASKVRVRGHGSTLDRDVADVSSESSSALGTLCDTMSDGGSWVGCKTAAEMLKASSKELCNESEECGEDAAITLYRFSSLIDELGCDHPDVDSVLSQYSDYPKLHHMLAATLQIKRALQASRRNDR